MMLSTKASLSGLSPSSTAERYDGVFLMPSAMSLNVMSASMRNLRISFPKGVTGHFLFSSESSI